MNSDHFDPMNPQISSIEVQEANIKPKKKVLQKNTVQRRQNKKQMGFVYNPYLRGLDEILDQKRDKTEERSRKINCYGHASIIKDPKYLDLQYRPRIKVNKKTLQLQGVTKIQKQIVQPRRQETQKKSCSDLRHRQQLLESWDLQQQRQKKIDFICTLILLIVLSLLVSKSFRQIFFGSYSKLRRLYDD